MAQIIIGLTIKNVLLVGRYKNLGFSIMTLDVVAGNMITFDFNALALGCHDIQSALKFINLLVVV